MVKKKKNSPKKAAQKLSKNAILGIGLIVLIISLSLAILAEQHRHNLIGNAQTNPPSYGSIGDCSTGNSCPSTSPNPSGTTATAPSTIPSTTATAIISGTQPCHGDVLIPKDEQHRSRRGEERGFMEMIFTFFKLILQFFLQLLSSNTATSTPVTPPPAVSPIPTSIPCPPTTAPTSASSSPVPVTSPITPVSQPASASGGTISYVAAGANDCGNSGYQTYIAKTSPKLNFGDPSCTFTKDKLYTMLKQSDAAHADNWFLTIIPGESGYNPNAYAPPSTGTPDSGGAWGLYQMGSSTPPEQAPPAPGKNGAYDRGDINWEIQTDNAIKYNTTVLKCSFKYWSAAKSFWGQFSC